MPRSPHDKLKRDPLGGTQVAVDTQQALQDRLRSGGRPLSDDVRRSFEPHVGGDLSDVRVHADQPADALARQMGAEAFTVGSDIFFQQGNFAPDRAGGQHLLAHELTHVVQRDSQRGTSGGMTIGRADDQVERAADANARRVTTDMAAAASSTISRMASDTGCGCGSHGSAAATTVRRDPTKTRDRSKRAGGSKRQGVNLGNQPLDFSQLDKLDKKSGGSKRMGVNLGHGQLDFSGLDHEDDLAPTTAPTTEPNLIPGQTVEDFLQAMAAPNAGELLHNVPSSGLGRFDAQYLPGTSTLLVTVRPLLNFQGKWSTSQKKTFTSEVVKQATAAWSGKHSFVCSKPGFEALKANVKIQVLPVTDPSAEHHVELKLHEKGKKEKTGIGREQNNGGNARNVGNFNHDDAPVRAHDTLNTRCKLATHDVIRIQGFLQERMPATGTLGRHLVTADPKGMTTEESKKVDDLVALLNHASELKATPVPLIVTYHAAPSDKGAKKRAEAVVKKLKAARNNPVRLVALSAEIKTKEKDHATALKMGADKGGYKAGGRYDSEAQQSIKDFKTNSGTAEITVHADEKWATTFKDTDPYSIIAHEFGHMLGNPDEYFGYGPGYMAMKKKQLDESLTPEDKLESARLTENKALEKFTTDVQDDWGKLVVSTGQKLPSMTGGMTATNSMMNAGAIVTPAHYATLLEALGRITSKVTPAVSQADWKFA